MSTFTCTRHTAIKVHILIKAIYQIRCSHLNQHMVNKPDTCAIRALFGSFSAKNSGPIQGNEDSFSYSHVVLRYFFFDDEFDD